MSFINDNSGLTPNHDIEALQKVIATEQNIRLTSSELANLWASWMESSIKECITKYFLKIVEEPDIKVVLEYTLNIARKHLIILTQIYKRENHPLPVGFTDEDVNLNAPRLFSDSFILYFIEDMAKIRLDGYSTALQMSTRTDVRKYFTECTTDVAEIYNKAVSVMLSKQICRRPPYIQIPERVDFVKKQSFLTGFLGKRRPLTSIEISHIFSGLQRNLLKTAMFNGFSQVTKSEQLRKYIERGKEIYTKHAEIFSSLLIKNDLPVSMSWDEGIKDSKIAPFSDKLIMQQFNASNVVLIGAYGKAIPVVGVRHDLGIDFIRLMAEVVKLAEDGINIMIEKGWFEEAPQAKGSKRNEKNFH